MSNLYWVIYALSIMILIGIGSLAVVLRIKGFIDNLEKRIKELERKPFFHLDASDDTTIVCDEYGRVNKWKDKSGNNNHLK